MTTKARCPWAGSDPLYLRYHDDEWGVPSHDDRHLFEMLILEGAQAGLSWITILRKRAAYRKAFDRFDPRRIARYDAKKLQALLGDEGIVRNRLKIHGAVQNARAFLDVQKEWGRSTPTCGRSSAAPRRSTGRARCRTCRRAPPTQTP